MYTAAPMRVDLLLFSTQTDAEVGLKDLARYDHLALIVYHQKHYSLLWAADWVVEPGKGTVHVLHLDSLAGDMHSCNVGPALLSLSLIIICQPKTRKISALKLSNICPFQHVGSA